MIFPRPITGVRHFMPTPMETLILRTCLAGPERAAESWLESTAQTNLRSMLVDRLSSLKRVLALLNSAVVGHRLTADEHVLAILRAASVWEEVRAKLIWTS